TIGGAALDVTDPEPLPDGHPLWEMDNAIITPHVANHWEIGLPLLAERVAENLRRDREGEELLGLVDVDLGY
ncbi:MAG TPA: NAD(P)-dependent oxidoreductase, partial [Actinomycetota bacterium]|nr:NAD(P)-dependent oxidoreductase [Actinomycetota bacterium]